MTTTAGKVALVVGTRGRGGIRSVIENYERSGFYPAGTYVFVPTHDDGARAKQLLVGVVGVCRALAHIAFGDVGLVHAHMSMRGSFWRKAAIGGICRIFDKPFLLHLHGSDFARYCESSGALTRRALRGTLRRADLVVVLSEYWREYVRGFSGVEAVVVRNFVPPAYHDCPISADRRGILFMGAIGERKGTFDLIEAVRRQAERGGRMTVVVAGNGEVERARRLVAAGGIQELVRVVGWVDGERKSALVRESGVFVLPSHNEGQPLAILEAMDAGMAIVTTPVGGIPEVIRDGENGLLVAPGDTEALGGALARLTADDAFRMAISARARRYYENHHSPDKVLPAMRRAYDRLTGAAP